MIKEDHNITLKVKKNTHLLDLISVLQQHQWDVADWRLAEDTEIPLHNTLETRDDRESFIDQKADEVLRRMEKTNDK